jgi:hypothetical protein
MATAGERRRVSVRRMGRRAFMVALGSRWILDFESTTALHKI